MKPRVFFALVLAVSAVLLFILPVGAKELDLFARPVDATVNTSDSEVEGASRASVPATGVAVAGQYAYIAAGASGLGIIDVSNPASPVEVKYFQTGFAQNVAVARNKAYVADILSGLIIVDVSDANTPLKAGSSKDQFLAQNVAVLGIYAFVADFGSQLHILDLVDPEVPTIGSASTADNAYGVAVAGKYAYVAARGSGLQIFDISNPRSPSAVGLRDTPGLALDVAVAEDYAYIADDTQGLRVISILNPSNPQNAGFYNTPGKAQGVAVVRNYAYVADGPGGLRIIDISDASNPKEVLVDTTPVDAADVAVAQGWVYVADKGQPGGLHTLYFAPPSSESVPPTGGELDSPYDDTHYIFPAGTFTDTVTITHTPRFANDVVSVCDFGSLVSIGHIFELEATFDSTGQPAQPVKPFTMTVMYSQGELGHAKEETLAFYYCDEGSKKWVLEESSQVNQNENTVTATPNHLSYWAVLGEPRGVFLPIVTKKQ